MFADPKNVTPRRWKRYVKAGLSLVIATAAGTFMACQKALDRRAQQTTNTNTSQPDVQTTPVTQVTTDAQSAQIVVRDAGSVNPSSTDSGAVTDATLDSSSRDVVAQDAQNQDAQTRDALAVRDAHVNRPRPRVDRHEHRNGMPVIDNLME